MFDTPTNPPFKSNRVKSPDKQAHRAIPTPALSGSSLRDNPVGPSRPCCAGTLARAAAWIIALEARGRTANINGMAVNLLTHTRIEVTAANIAKMSKAIQHAVEETRAPDRAETCRTTVRQIAIRKGYAIRPNGGDAA